VTGELAVAAGAALGAPSRYLLDGAVRSLAGARLPWGTLAVNLLGSAAAGLVAGLRPGTLTVALVAVGFLGSFTTASTLAAELVGLVEQGRARAALLLLALHVLPGLALAGAGLAVGLAL
jgi:CrcB protein